MRTTRRDDKANSQATNGARSSHAKSSAMQHWRHRPRRPSLPRALQIRHHLVDLRRIPYTNNADRAQ